MAHRDSLFQRARGFVLEKKVAVIGCSVLFLCLVAFATSERRWLMSEQEALASEIMAVEDGQVEKVLQEGGFMPAGVAYSGGVATDLPDIYPLDCEDHDTSCREWAAAGECVNNPEYMVGNREVGLGHCIVSCGVCGGSTVKEAEEECEDVNPNCAALRDAGMCDKDRAWMVGENGRKGQCRRSCGACSVPDFQASFETLRHSENEGNKDKTAKPPDSSVCADISQNCEAWAEQGMCEDNIAYMVGAEGHVGQCRRTCGACGPEATVEEPESIMNSLPSGQSFEAMPLKWPVKALASKKVCVGLTTVPCQRGLWTPQVATVDPKDRSRVSPGVGGPTGCTEAWATLLQRDADLPGVLVLIYTIRKYSQEDRDIIVFVAGNVTADSEEQLQKSCVQVLRIAEPYNPDTHVGFNKISMWLAVEYDKIAFFEPNVWFRRRPDQLFQNHAPASVQAPRHPRVVHEAFNPGAFILQPSRETFFDMLTKAGTIDSAEKMPDGRTVFLDTLFFTGYFVHWTTISQNFVHPQSHLVDVLRQEAAEPRLHVTIKSMPPYSPYTLLDYRLIQGVGIQNSVSVPPWHPGWRLPCAYPCSQRQDEHLHEAISEEWWHYYYDLIGFQLPSNRAGMRLLMPHDPQGGFSRSELDHCLPFNCDVPDTFHAEMDDFQDVLHRVKATTSKMVLLNHGGKMPKGIKKHRGRRLRTVF